MDLKGFEQVEYGAGKRESPSQEVESDSFQLIRDGLSLILIFFDYS